MASNRAIEFGCGGGTSLLLLAAPQLLQSNMLCIQHRVLCLQLGLKRRTTAGTTGCSGIAWLARSSPSARFSHPVERWPYLSSFKNSYSCTCTKYMEFSTYYCPAWDMLAVIRVMHMVHLKKYFKVKRRRRKVFQSKALKKEEKHSYGTTGTQFSSAVGV